MKKFNLVKSLITEPGLNILLDKELLILVGGGAVKRTVRFYKNTDSVILGKFQNKELEVNLHYCNKNHIPVIKRFTGGGTVFQDLGNLNIAVALPKNELISQYLTENMHILSKSILNALNTFDIEGEIGSHCEILISGKKISGCAAAQKYGGFLYHATLLMHSDLKKLNKTLTTKITKATDKKYIRSNHTKVTNLYSIKKIPEKDLQRAIFMSIKKCYNTSKRCKEK